MNSSPENNDSLQNLLKIKRYEQPPPGYFGSFSQKVIARIHAESIVKNRPWWRQWYAEIAEQPLLASTYGLLFAGLVVVAVGLAQSSTDDGLDGGFPLVPRESVYRLSEAGMSEEFAIRSNADGQGAASSLSPAPSLFTPPPTHTPPLLLHADPGVRVPSPFGLPSTPVNRAAYQP
jgi:hypothetical protein